MTTPHSDDRTITVERAGAHWSGLTLYQYKTLRGFLLSELQQLSYYEEMKKLLYPRNCGAVRGGDSFFYDYDIEPLLRRFCSPESNH